MLKWEVSNPNNGGFSLLIGLDDIAETNGEPTITKLEPQQLTKSMQKLNCENLHSTIITVYIIGPG
jgi:hypothetical protein